MALESTFLQYWSNAAKEKGDSPFLKISQIGTPPVLSYSYSIFRKRAMRVAVVFKDVLKITPGQKVILLVEENNDLALLMHGLWMSEICAVPVSVDYEIDQIKNILKTLDAQHVVFTPSLAAKISEVLKAAPSVKSWIVTGKSGKISGFDNIKPLEELLVSVSGEEIRAEKDEGIENDLLIIPEFNTHLELTTYTQKSLIDMGQTCSALYSEHQASFVAWNMFSLLTFDGILFSLLAPLFNNMPSLIMPLDDIRDFWRHITASSIGLAVIHMDLLPQLIKVKKQAGFSLPNDFSLSILCNGYLSSDLINDLEKGFDRKTKIFFSDMKLGGVLAVSDSQEAHKTFEGAVSVGRLAPDIDAKISNDDRLFIKNPKALLSEKNLHMKFDEEGFCDACCLAHFNGEELFLKGQAKDIQYKNGKSINLAKIEQALISLRGVVYAQAVSVPSAYSGCEISAYIVLNRLAKLQEIEIEVYLSEKLDPHEMPYQYEIQFGDSRSTYPTREEILAKMLG